MESLHKNMQLMLVLLQASFSVLHFSYCSLPITIINLPDDDVCSIAIYVVDNTLYSEGDQASDLQQQLELVPELESDLNSGAIDVKMYESVLVEKISFKMLGLSFSSKLDWGSCIVSIAKKIRALSCSMKFLLHEVALYLYKSTKQLCMEYCRHVWTGAPSYYLDMLGKLQKCVCRTVGPTLAASLELLEHIEI